MTEKNYKKIWADRASKELVGKTIKQVRYLTEKVQEDLMWYSSSLVIFFTDGSYMFPSQDDEGNDAGALFTSFENLPTIPVI